MPDIRVSLLDNPKYCRIGRPDMSIGSVKEAYDFMVEQIFNQSFNKVSIL